MKSNNDSLTFRKVEEFEKELKKFKKKYRTLEDDLVRFEEVLKGLLPNTPPGTHRISRLGHTIKVPIYKATHFHCKCLNKGSRSGFRLIFAFLEDELGIVFIEIYHHNKKDIEDRERIFKYFKEKEFND
ncbi:hypothetical protein [Methanobacterium spitsbergense]|uniref:Uncharacterized protein n=1 Tax=Methanobacterium spitsbergense TaxID=2874285 RepID=A0A8T5V0T3_9EURY|nr:hypothetical protein [Methanobacterium spitsbergense]MBZ2166633.1 hypothetical protein [Methanobacterium spitsbergense]